MESGHRTQARRVKVYTLDGDKWIDKGTGYCTGELKGGPHFMVRNENNSSEILLKASIEGSMQYQRQQDTLIVWTDLEGNDYALSFQEPEGCLALCKFLIDLQRTTEPNISLVAVFSNGEDGEVTEVIAGPVPEPSIPTDDNLAELLDLVSQGSKFPKFREMLLAYIQEKKYLHILIDTFHRNETRHKISNLHYLCDIIKTIIFYNDPDILDTLLEDDTIDGVLGMLEYDVELGNMKTNNREYLAKMTRSQEVVPITNNDIKNLLKKTFRLQFLKDVVLARVLDDATFNGISNHIQINEERILKFIKNDRCFLADLFEYFNTDGTTEPGLANKRQEAIRLLHQMVLIAKELQPSPRTRFFKALIEKGLFKAVQFALKQKCQDDISRVLATEVIVTIIEHDVFLFRKSCGPGNNESRFLESRDTYDTALINILTGILINEPNIGLKTQAFEALKMILDPSNLTNAPESLRSSPANSSSDDDNDCITNPCETFLESFYKYSANRLFAPLMTINENNMIGRGDMVTYIGLCELCSFIAREHDKFYSHRFIVERKLLDGVAQLMDKKYPYQLRICALRCIKVIILLDDDILTSYIIQNETLSKFVSFLTETNNCNSLVNSVCLNLLEILIQNNNLRNFHRIGRHLVTSYGRLLKDNFLGEHLVQIMSIEEDQIETTNDGEEDNKHEVLRSEDSSLVFGEEDRSADISSLQTPADMSNIDTSILLERREEDGNPQDKGKNGKEEEKSDDRDDSTQAKEKVVDESLLLAISKA
ncbi:hypothetical protein FOA43_003547 [Brettanomyces nanus]|uniref:Serine/threonine-protein phosphatase 4 regulatory subunit 3-like central domain-containing protein n=1 Tax=Eeniella nana TaxID=13502 RepID=A0A875S384_EENNA|nr:uncharacterized protein FOA43_003547 [Brettanomyces nanus]QPG76161.1 hypothetical protein FOA43_003547 [Brettanomyces nanus]